MKFIYSLLDENNRIPMIVNYGLLVNYDSETTFLTYHQFYRIQKDLQKVNLYFTVGFKNSVQFLTALKTTQNRRKGLCLVKRVGSICGTFVFIFKTVQRPKVFVRNFIIGQSISGISFFLIELWKKEINKKTLDQPEKVSIFSKKILVIGTLAVGFTIGSILYYKPAISRFLFSPKFQELITKKYTATLAPLDQKGILDSGNFEKNLFISEERVAKILEKFGLENYRLLALGKFPIKLESTEEVFTLLVRLLTQMAKLTQYSLVLDKNKIPDLTPAVLEEFTTLNKTVYKSICSVVAKNPTEMALFKNYTIDILNEVRQGKNITFSTKLQKDMIAELIAYYMGINWYKQKY